MNARREFVKGDPKNYIPDDAITRIAERFLRWDEQGGYAKAVTVEEVGDEEPESRSERCRQ